MVIPTGINVNKRNREEKMTEEEVKALIQELRDEIPAIHSQLHKDIEAEEAIGRAKFLKEEKAKENK